VDCLLIAAWRSDNVHAPCSKEAPRRQAFNDNVTSEVRQPIRYGRFRFEHIGLFDPD
jgi:hypothetical protein